LRIDWHPVDMFIAFLDGHATVEQVLAHPAYAAIGRHLRLTAGIDLSPQHLLAAVAGDQSPFYGLRNVHANRGAIEAFAREGKAESARWLAEATDLLCAICDPGELAGVTVYPVVGYDAGIGLDEVACLNVSWPGYLADPQEFAYMISHEVCHVVYKRTRPLPSLAESTPAGGWRQLFWRMTQDEGYAVYLSLRMRRERGHMGTIDNPILADYQVIADELSTKEHLNSWVDADLKLARGAGDDPKTASDLAFGPRRLTYRAGCAVVDRIQASEGDTAVRQAFRLPPAEYIARYGPRSPLLWPDTQGRLGD